ncbi:hypothetical protein [Shewanella donghaensis]|uniref:hypothetical protein n=1 Tax=Shewanella donghaensis TaxID=238836 RepID=UPI00118366CB|nr:hypothetical protein [Shewanella donghaensis]
MNPLLNKKNLLITVGFLVFLKFGAVPVWDWQTSKISEIQQLKSRLDRAESLFEQGSKFEDVLQQATEINKQRLESINVTNNLANLKLAKMEELDQLLSSYNVRVTSSSWMADTGVDLIILNLKVGVRGTTKDVLRAVLGIRQMQTATAIDDLSFRIVKMKDDSLGDAGGSIVVSFYVLGPEMAEKYGVELKDAVE